MEATVQLISAKNKKLNTILRPIAAGKAYHFQNVNNLIWDWENLWTL